MSTPTAVRSRLAASAESTAPYEGLSLAELLDVLGVPDEQGLPPVVPGTHGSETS